jgi:hypothetical protein
VIGSLGRCGSGAVTFFKKIGMNKWVLFPTFHPHHWVNVTRIKSLLAVFFSQKKTGTTSLNGTWQRLPEVAHSKKFLKVNAFTTPST